MSIRENNPSAAEAALIPDHTLLRVIGRGSYGEVWLARNVMGTQRAVKIVRRSGFESDRPYLREFEGIRRCEPVSRAHDGLIDILHMGRNDDSGFFYYVMELADSVSVEAYRPATLAERISSGPRMEAGDCLRIAESLAGALAFLHEQGLIHRDVKPSNILFAGGVPKLGDTGLVAEAGSSRSFVGTEGYVPQEGPGTERADIFALGKVLYEALTGMDRSQFPLLPPDWRQAYDFEQRVELNEIVLRACEGHSERRYHTAREMLADVAIVASGRSVRKLRGMENRLRLFKWAAAGVAGLAVLGVAAAWLNQRERERAQDLRHAQETTDAERYGRLLADIRAARLELECGAVTEGLVKVAQAAKIDPARDLRDLRDEAAFLLGRPDLVYAGRLKITKENEYLVAGHAATNRCLVCDYSVAPALISVRALDGSISVEVPFRERGAVTSARFSPDGARAIIRYSSSLSTVLETANPAGAFGISPGSTEDGPVFFCGPGKLVRRLAAGPLEFLDAKDGSVVNTVEIEAPPRSYDGLVFPSLDGASILIASPSNGAWLVDAVSGNTLWRRARPGPGRNDYSPCTWSPDGSTVVLRCGQQVIAMDAATGTPLEMPHRLSNGGAWMDTLGGSSLVYTQDWNGTGWIQDISRCEPLLRLSGGGGFSFDRKTRKLFFNHPTPLSVREWRPSPVVRTLGGYRSGPGSVFISFSPDERWLIQGDYLKSFRWWSLAPEEGDVPVLIQKYEAATFARFNAAGTVCRLFSAEGVTEYDYVIDSQNGKPRPGSPRPFPAGRDLAGLRINSISASTDESVLVVSAGELVRLIRNGRDPYDFQLSAGYKPVSVSPDGTLFAIGVLNEQAAIYSATDPERGPLRHLPLTSCTSVFSPDGRWLACSGDEYNCIYEVNSWQPVKKWPHTGGTGHAMFTADGRWLAISRDQRSVTIMEAGTWRDVLTLASPVGESLGRLVFSPSGRWLAAAGARGEMYAWDLRAMQEELTKLGLSGDLPGR